LAFLLGGLGIITGNAQIIINVPLSQTLSYGALANADYIFQGAERVNLNANNTSVTGSVAIEGVEVRLGANAKMSNVSGVTISNGGRLRVFDNWGDKLPDNAPVSLNSGTLHFLRLMWSVEKIGDIVLDGG